MISLFLTNYYTDVVSQRVYFMSGRTIVVFWLGVIGTPQLRKIPFLSHDADGFLSVLIGLNAVIN